LGVRNVLRVAVHRFLKKTRYYQWILPIAAVPSGEVFSDPPAPAGGTGYDGACAHADTVLSGRLELFGCESLAGPVPPAWLTNPKTGKTSVAFDQHWSRIPDFDPDLGDIKLIWEQSRFHWILVFARAYLQSGKRHYIEHANAWCRDWNQCNPVNRGPNWMCGQETAIRLNHILLADALLQPDGPRSDFLEALVRAHCQRIAASVSYAVAQSNNHVISEAVGLFLGGTWLAKHSPSTANVRKGTKWQKRGRSLLEDSVSRLVMADGSFSQYSTTYHRLLLDTLSIAEWWRSRMGQPKFSEPFYAKARKATYWLRNFVDEDSGDVPNIGANDGALVYALTDGGHRDFRPTVQLAGVLFCQENIYGDGPWREALETLGIVAHTYPRPDQLGTACFPIGGFAVLRSTRDASRMYCRFPNFEFRPSQSDILHVDLWSSGVNLLRDGGSYTYARQEDARYFAGTASHNTCQFDDHDQMPRLGRFLFGKWLRTQSLALESDDERLRFAASYTDHLGCRHERTVSRSPAGWVVVDDIGGHREKAVLCWRLSPDADWIQMENGLKSDLASLTFSSASSFQRIDLVTGWESRSYMSRTELPVVEIELGPGHHRVMTEIELNPSAR
jgi:hypothetical protein